MIHRKGSQRHVPSAIVATLLLGTLVMNTLEPVTRAFAATPKPGRIPATFGNPSGPWSMYLQHNSLPAFLNNLGLDFSQTNTLSAFGRVMDRTELNLNTVLTESSPNTQNVISKAVQDYADTCLVRSRLIRLLEHSSDQSPLETGPATTPPTALPAALLSMGLDGELMDLKQILAILPKEKGLEILEETLEIRSHRFEKLLEKAQGMAQKLQLFGRNQDSSAHWQALDEMVQQLVARTPQGYPDAREAFDPMFSNQMALLKAARLSPNLSWTQRGIAYAALGKRLKEVQAWRWRVATGPNSPEAAISHLASGKPLTPEDRRLLEDLREYVPGINPDLAVLHARQLDDYSMNGIALEGWALRLGVPQGQIPPATLMTIGSHVRSFTLKVRYAIHEGLHQGDLEYRKGIIALEVLLGQDIGQELAMIFLEGFTEYRTRATILRLLRDGYQGKNALAMRFAQALQEEFQTVDLETLEQRLQEDWEPRPYTPFVRLAETLFEEVGIQTMESLFVRGDARPLVSGLGQNRLMLLGRLAVLYHEYGYHHYPPRAKSWIAEASGLNVWLVAKMQDVVSGRIDSEKDISAIETAARAWTQEAEKLLAREKRTYQFNLLEALDETDFERYRAFALSGDLSQVDIRDDIKRRLGEKRPKTKWRFIQKRLKHLVSCALGAGAYTFTFAVMFPVQLLRADVEHGLFWTLTALAFSLALASIHLFSQFYRAYTYAHQNLPWFFNYLYFDDEAKKQETEYGPWPAPGKSNLNG